MIRRSTSRHFRTRAARPPLNAVRRVRSVDLLTNPMLGYNLALGNDQTSANRRTLARWKKTHKTHKNPAHPPRRRARHPGAKGTRGATQMSRNALPCIPNDKSREPPGISRRYISALGRGLHRRAGRVRSPDAGVILSEENKSSKRQYS